MTNETIKDREARLQRISDYQHDGLASETIEEREARLHHQHDRLTSETAEDRETRLQYHRDQGWPVAKTLRATGVSLYILRDGPRKAC